LEESDEIKDEDVDFLTNIALKFADIQRTQQVEYHFAHLMDKPFEASFGFIHVLPGAFSAYNMAAIMDYDKEDDKLLRDYFKSID
jgi:chitin synthase